MTVARLVEFGRIRLLADGLGIESIDRERHLLVIRFRGDAAIDPRRLVDLVQRRPEVTLTPPGVLRVDLELTRGRQDRRARRRLDSKSTSWWTERATSGDVAGGFTKEKMSRSKPAAADDELLERVGGLLAELSGTV